MAASPSRDDVITQLRRLLLGDGAQERGWRLEVGASTLSGAGEGVRVRGECAASSVVALYPGIVFQSEDLPVMHKLVLPGNDYVLLRRDGILLDGRPDGTSQQLYDVALQRDLASGAPPLLASEFSVGNKINHPYRALRDPNTRCGYAARDAPMRTPHCSHAACGCVAR